MAKDKSVRQEIAEVLLETKVARQKATWANQSYVGNYWEDHFLGKEIEVLKEIIKKEESE